MRFLTAARRKYVDDPVDALDRRIGVERREYEVARFRDAERCLDCLEIPHFPDEHHVRVLSEHVKPAFKALA